MMDESEIPDQISREKRGARGPEELALLTDKALRSGDHYSIARLVSLFEDSRPSSFTARENVIRLLRQSELNRRGTFFGITGAPGVGKSTLLGKLALRLVEADESIRVAVLAVDPSSEISGGALLGDRTRIHFPTDEARLFFRSQASRRDPGGISRSTFSSSRLLYYLFDYVMIETVGIGQNEIEIRNVADRVYLILQPSAGDQIQFMKAGIMEIPDVFVINKSDQTAAERKTFYSLQASIGLVRPGDEPPPILRVSALTESGIGNLTEDLREFRKSMHLKDEKGYPSDRSLKAKEQLHFAKWVEEEFGKRGIRLLQENGGANHFILDRGGIDSAMKDFSALLE